MGRRASSDRSLSTIAAAEATRDSSSSSSSRSRKKQKKQSSTTIVDKENMINQQEEEGTSPAVDLEKMDDGDDDDEEEVMKSRSMASQDAASALMSMQSPQEKQSKRKRRQLIVENDDNDQEMDESSKDNTDTNAIVQSPKTRINHPGKPPEAGVIKKIYVENFMCHRKLTVELCRNVNFIHGQNGSGKSAILAAIQICLGAGARRTHRARNLKDLVRKESNCTGAKVRVTLLNRGDDGFQRDVYGDTITVERTISLKGGYNGFKLYSHDMKEISRKKQDLDLILDQLNIQVENPVAVLDQEDAKKFLTGKSTDKYEFFMKATELTRLDNTYASITENITELKESNERIIASLQGQIDTVNDLKKEWEEFQQLEILEEKVDLLKIDYAWAYYNGCQNDVEAEERNLALIQSKLDKRKEEVAKAEEQSNTDLENEEKVMKERMTELTEEAQDAAKKKKKLEDELKKAQMPIKSKERELANIVGREMKGATIRHNNAKKQLQEVRDEIRNSIQNKESDIIKRQEALEAAEAKLKDAKVQADVYRQEMSETQRQYEEMEPSVAQATDEKDNARYRFDQIQNKINDLKAASSDGNNMAMFGRKCTAVYKLVQQAKRNGRFQGKVFGPIGAYIKVAPGKEHLAPIAELALGGGSLDRFIVTNSKDRALFMKIRKDAGCGYRDCNVFQQHDNPKRHAVRDPPPGVETVASALSITEDLVFNCLVDQKRIDLQALSTSKEESESSLLIQRDDGTSAVRGNMDNVYFLPKGDRWFVRNGSKAIVSHDRVLKQVIGVDRTDAIKQATNEAKDIQAELQTLQQKETEIKKQHKQYKVRWNKAKGEDRKTSKTIEQLENTIEEIKADAENAESNSEIDTTDLEEDVANTEQQLNELKEHAKELEEEIQSLRPAVEDFQGQLEEVIIRNEKIENDLETTERKLENHYRTLSQRQSQLEKKREKLQKAETALAQQSNVVTERIGERDHALRSARKATHNRNVRENAKNNSTDEGGNMLSLSQEEMLLAPSDEELEKIEPRQTPKERDYYATKIKRAMKKIAEEKERRQLSEKDPEVVYRHYVNAKKKLDSATESSTKIDKNVAELTKDMRERKKRWRQFRNHIELMTNGTFDEMLNKKGSSGELEFDHQDGTLELIVQKDNRDQQSQTRDVKALSGGERSFTTLSLLLALGEHLETPFRVMDEFDVFLDPVSRKIALETLIEVAKSLEHRQFIFITPQDLSSMRTDSRLKIFGMKPPARSSTVGGPTQQTLD